MVIDLFSIEPHRGPYFSGQEEIALGFDDVQPCLMNWQISLRMLQFVLIPVYALLILSFEIVFAIRKGLSCLWHLNEFNVYHAPVY